MVSLAPADKMEDRRTEYPGIEIFPLKFAASELQTSHWRFLMGGVEIRQRTSANSITS